MYASGFQPDPESHFEPVRWGDAEDRFLELLKRGTVDDIEEMVKMIAFENVNVKAVHEINNVDYSLLSHAVIYGNLRIVNQLLEKGADPKWQNANGQSALMIAAKEGKDEIAQSLISSNIPQRVDSRTEKQRRCNQQNKSGWSSLHAAVQNKRHTMIQLLLEHGADVNIAMETGWTPLHVAAKGADITAINILLASGADPTRRAKHRDFGKECIPHDCTNNKEARELLKPQASGDRVPAPSTSVVSTFGNQRSRGASRPTERVTSKEWTRNEDRFVELMKNESKANNERMQQMLDIIHVNAEHCVRDIEYTLLTHAVSCANSTAIRMLMEAGSDPMWQNSKGGTALITLARKGDVKNAEVIINGGIDEENNEKRIDERKKRVDQTTSTGWSALHSAIENKKADFVELLLKYDADVNIQMSTGWSPLHVACKINDPKMVELLLDHGADRLLQARHRDYGRNCTPEDCTTNQEIVQLLQTHIPSRRLQ